MWCLCKHVQSRLGMICRQHQRQCQGMWCARASVRHQMLLSLQFTFCGGQWWWTNNYTWKGFTVLVILCVWLLAPASVFHLQWSVLCVATSVLSCWLMLHQVIFLVAFNGCWIHRHWNSQTLSCGTGRPQICSLYQLMAVELIDIAVVTLLQHES